MSAAARRGWARQSRPRYGCYSRSAIPYYLGQVGGYNLIAGSVSTVVLLILTLSVEPRGADRGGDRRARDQKAVGRRIYRSRPRKRLKFRALLRRPGVTVMPGGFSPLYAALAQMAGFECFFLAGSQLSAFLYGVPDNGILAARPGRSRAPHGGARRIFNPDRRRYRLRNAVNVYYTVQECVRAGVAALQIEDQEAPKNPRRSRDAAVIPTTRRSARSRRRSRRATSSTRLAICARCDILGAEGSNFREAVTRCTAYIEEGGADLVWLNSVETRDDVKKRVPRNRRCWRSGAAGRRATIEEYGAIGVQITLYSVIAATAGLQASWRISTFLRNAVPWRCRNGMPPICAANGAGPISAR